MPITSWGRSRPSRNNVCTVCGEFYTPDWYSTHVARSAGHAAALARRRRHAPKDVYETHEGYRCGICRRPVVRYSAPRARWVHEEVE